jgi:hypothetical protein
MYGYKKERQDLFVIQNGQCPSCGQRVNIKVSAEKESVRIIFVPLTYVIPLTYRKEYYGTCGSCFMTFRLDKKETERLLAEKRKQSPV